MKVLLVDDSRAARMLISSLIKSFDVQSQILEAENGSIAVELYGREHPDVTFLDLTMPVMDGYEALEEILRQDPNAAVVIITADYQPKAVQKCMDMGAFDVIQKLPDKKVITDLMSQIQNLNGRDRDGKK